MRQYRFLFMAGTLLLLLFLQLMLIGARKSPVWDEPGHIASGVAYVQKSTLAVNPQHPPLLKVLAGLSLTLAGARWPDTQQSHDLIRGASQYQWQVGSAILTAAGLDRALFWARLPMMLVAVLGGLLIYIWGRQIAGEWAGLCALGIYTLDPTILGHGHLVTMDVGLAAFTLLFLFCLWNYARTSVGSRLNGWGVCSGLALGALLCTKFSALVMAPVAAILVLVARSGSPRFHSKPEDLCPCGSGRKFKNCHAMKIKEQHPPLAPALRALLWVGLIAALTVEAVYLFHSPTAYFDGIRLVNADHAPNFLAYLGGRMEPWFATYFAEAYLLKEPLAAIGLAAAGVVVLWRDRTFDARTRWFLLLPPIVLFAAHMWKADNLGVRYIIPCLPFAHLAGGIALAALLQSTAATKRVAGGLLAIWLVLAAVGIYPDDLSYFNESACLLTDPGKLGMDDGSRCGIAWLSDSNVDWGGSLKELKAWLDVHAKGRTAGLAYFGSFPPEAYGIVYGNVDAAQLMSAPVPGLYVISAHYVAAYSGVVRKYGQGIDWLRQTSPVAVIGHSLYVYDIPAR